MLSNSELVAKSYGTDLFAKEDLESKWLRDHEDCHKYFGVFEESEPKSTNVAIAEKNFEQKRGDTITREPAKYDFNLVDGCLNCE